MNYCKLFTFCVIFQFQTMFKTIVGAGAVGAGAASRYGSGSGQMMRLRLRNTVHNNKNIIEMGRMF
jgi:hypothetical protein